MNIKFIKLPGLAIIIIALLVFTNLITLQLFKGVSSSEAGQEVGNSLIDPARSLYTDENLVTNLEPLRKYLKGLPEREKDKANLSIYFEVFTTGANISVNPDLRIWPASLAKLPLAMVVMKKIEEGSMKEDTLLEFTKADQDPTDTSGMDQRIGNKFPVKLLVENLLYYSSNPAYFMLKREVTDNELSGIVNAVGLEELFTPDGKVSSKEYSRLFRSLYVASYLNQENSQMLLSYMQKSTNEGYLKAGIPEDVPFAHKWGQNLFYNVHSDAGIVYAEKRPYLISVMIEAKDEKNSTATIYSQQLMKEISEKVYKYVKEEKID